MTVKKFLRGKESLEFFFVCFLTFFFNFLCCLCYHTFVLSIRRWRKYKKMEQVGETVGIDTFFKGLNCDCLSNNLDINLYHSYSIMIKHLTAWLQFTSFQIQLELDFCKICIQKSTRFPFMQNSCRLQTLINFSNFLKFIA